MINNVVLVGRLTRDPELRYTPSNVAVATFSLAVNRNFKNQAGDREADFISCIMWRQQAENFANWLKKGALVGITGRIQTRNYDNQHGQRVYVTEVVAESFQTLEKKDNSANQSSMENQMPPSYGQGEPMDISDDDLPFQGGSKMNKQELIEKIGSLDKLYGEKYYVALDDVLDLVKQLDEPEKVVVPQFVVGWIEEARKSCKDVADFFDFDFTNEEVGKWFMQERPFDLAARAQLDGYEVEKEKRYLVKVKGVNEYGCYLNKGSLSKEYFLESKAEIGLKKCYSLKKKATKTNSD